MVFYHPLDDFVERTQGQTWAGTAGFTGGKVGQGTSAVTVDALGFGPEYAPASVGSADLCLPLDGTHVLCIGTSRSVVAVVVGADVTFGPTAAGTGCSYSQHMGDVLDWDGTAGHAVAFLQSDVFNGTVNLWTISAGMNITRIFKDWKAGAVHYGSVAAIDSTRFLIAGRDATAGATKAAVCTRSGGDFTFGPDVAFPVDAWIGAIARLDSSRLIVFYLGTASSTPGKARVATVSGTDVTFGAATEVTTLMSIKQSRAEFCAAAAIGADKVLLLWTNVYSPVYAKVATVSGTDITVGALATVEADASQRMRYLRCAHMGSGRVCVAYAHGGTSKQYARSGQVSGSAASFGGRTEIGASSQYGPGLASVSATRCAAFTYTTASVLRIGDLGLDASMAAPTPAAYPAATGKDRLAVAMWASKPTSDSTSLVVQRDYTVALTATSITLGPASAVWSGAGIGDLMSALNAVPPPPALGHLLVLDFEHTGSGNWNLRTSVDGAAWTDQGAQTSGTRSTAPGSSAPSLDVSPIPPGASDQWYDELVMWAGDKSQFQRFTAEELANLHDLADVFGDPMDQYENNFGAPICWQATARMPDGSVWRDSGCGPCPPVVRVPRGASDIVVTDDGAPANPMVVEG